MRHDDWPKLVTLFQAALHNDLSPQRENVAPITDFTGRPSSNQVSKFLRSADFNLVSITESNIELAVNVSEFVRFMDGLHPLIHQHTRKELELI